MHSALYKYAGVSMQNCGQLIVSNTLSTCRSPTILTYAQAKDHIKPLAIVFFSGNEAVSALIRLGEALEQALRNKSAARIFSHVGVIVTSDIMPSIKNAVPGKLYIMESTASGKFISEAMDVESGKGVLGVQIRDFEYVCAVYSGVVAVANLAKNPFDRLPEELDHTYDERITHLRHELDTFHKDHYHRHYQVNVLRLMSALIPAFRGLRILFPMSKKWIFCSELVALLYRSVGILHAGVTAENVVPMDFIVDDGDGEIPSDLFSAPMCYIKTLVLEKEMYDKEKIKLRMEQAAIQRLNSLTTTDNIKKRKSVPVTAAEIEDSKIKRKDTNSDLSHKRLRTETSSSSDVKGKKSTKKHKKHKSEHKSTKRGSWYSRLIKRSIDKHALEAPAVIIHTAALRSRSSTQENVPSASQVRQNIASDSGSEPTSANVPHASSSSSSHSAGPPPRQSRRRPSIQEVAPVIISHIVAQRLRAASH